MLPGVQVMIMCEALAGDLIYQIYDKVSLWKLGKIA